MQQHQTIDWLKCIICQKEGPKTKCQSTGKPSQAALTLAQLLKFNSVRHTRKTEECTRLVKSQETPLPVHIGVMLHMKTRKRDIIDYIHLACQFRTMECYDCRQIWQTLFVNTSRRRTPYALQT